MNDNTKKYWTDDPELVEKYILNKVSIEEKKRLDAEIAVCEPCKAKLHEEMEIAAGIRHYGRDILKAKLRKKLQRERASQFFTYQYFGLAAAVVIIAIGLGAYQIWFSDLVAPKKFHRQEIVFKQSEDSTGGKTESTIDERRKEERLSSQQKMQLSSKDEMRKTERSVAVQSAPTVSSIEQQQGASGAALKSDGMLSEASSTKSPASAIWLIGQIVVVNESVHEQGMSASKIQKGNDAKFAQRKKSETNSLSLESIALNNQTKENNIVLQQRSMKDLPPERLQQLAQKKREVETLLERTDNGIQLTLYDDSINESDVKDAVVERLSEDSIVVSISNQRIAYRLPSGWNSISSGRR